MARSASGDSVLTRAVRIFKAAIVPVGTPRQAVTGVLTTASRGITRALASPAR